MEALDSLARRYGCLPSEVIRVRHTMKAFSINLWAHNWGVQAEQIALRKAQERARQRRHGR